MSTRPAFQVMTPRLAAEHLAPAVADALAERGSFQPNPPDRSFSASILFRISLPALGWLFQSVCGLSSIIFHVTFHADPFVRLLQEKPAGLEVLAGYEPNALRAVP